MTHYEAEGLPGLPLRGDGWEWVEGYRDVLSPELRADVLRVESGYVVRFYDAEAVAVIAIIRCESVRQAGMVAARLVGR